MSLFGGFNYLFIKIYNIKVVQSKVTSEQYPGLLNYKKSKSKTIIPCYSIITFPK